MAHNKALLTWKYSIPSQHHLVRLTDTSRPCHRLALGAKISLTSGDFSSPESPKKLMQNRSDPLQNIWSNFCFFFLYGGVDF